MEIGTIWFIVALVVIALEVWAIWSIIGSERRAERKMLRGLLVVYAPVPRRVAVGLARAAGSEGAGGAGGNVRRPLTLS